MTDQMVPQDPAAEASVVASLMVDAEAFDRIAHIVDGPDFLRDQNRWAFEACKALWTEGVTVNEVTVATRMGDKLEKAGGMPFLSKLTTDLPTSIGVEHYAATVRRMKVLRDAITAGSNIVKLAYAKPTDLEGFLGDCEKEVGALHGEAGGELVRVGDLLDKYWAEPGVMDRDTNVLRFGYGDVDALLGGIAPGNLCVVAARPGAGKTNLLLNIGRNAAVGQGWTVAIVTLEMSEEEWRDRLLACETGIELDKVRQRQFNDADQRVAYDRTLKLADLPMYVYDRPAQTVDQLRAYARRLRATVGLDLLIVDYLQLIGATKRGRETSRYQEVSDISRGLKVLARELDIPIIAACQLNREVEHRKPPRPMLSDLRDSGAIEQDADQVVMLYRADKYKTRAEWDADPKCKGREYPEGITEVNVEKNRHGPTGRSMVRMYDAISRVSPIAERVEAAAPWAE